MKEHYKITPIIDPFYGVGISYTDIPLCEIQLCSIGKKFSNYEKFPFTDFSNFDNDWFEMGQSIKDYFKQAI